MCQKNAYIWRWANEQILMLWNRSSLTLYFQWARYVLEKNSWKRNASGYSVFVHDWSQHTLVFDPNLIHM